MTIHPDTLSKEDFILRFGGVFEHSPWIAQSVFEQGLNSDCKSASGLHRAMLMVLARANEEQQLTLICAHPDLAGKLALAGHLTAESTKEQASAGLDLLTPEERTRFTALNSSYVARFGFPFIIAVRGRSKHDILEAFETRLLNTKIEEKVIALDEISKIALLRLKDLLP